jgi:hypothetical protein
MGDSFYHIFTTPYLFFLIICSLDMIGIHSVIAKNYHKSVITLISRKICHKILFQTLYNIGWNCDSKKVSNELPSFLSVSIYFSLVLQYNIVILQHLTIIYFIMPDIKISRTQGKCFTFIILLNASSSPLIITVRYTCNVYIIFYLSHIYH